MDYYRHLFEEMQRETADKMDEVLRPRQQPVAVKTLDKKPN